MAFGQQQTDPCGGMFNWPNNNNWSQQEVIGMACSQSYVVQPSNWSTPTYPNGAQFDVILGAPAPTNLDIQATLNKLTVLSGAGNINMQASTFFDVQTYDFQTDGTMTLGGGGGFNPYIRVTGLFKKSAGAGTLDLSGHSSGGDHYFNLEGGTVQVDSGMLKLGRGERTGGNFVVAAGAAVDLNDGSSFLNQSGTYTGTGAGAVQLNSGILNISNPGATFNFAGALFQWNGGTIGAGAPFVNAGTMTLLGSGGWGISGGGFHNQGTMIHSGTGALQWGANAFMTNDATGTYDIRSDGIVSNGGRIDNHGMFKKSAGAGTSQVYGNNPDDTYFNHLGGTVEVDTGTLKLGRGDNTGGSFVVAANAVLDLNSGGNFAGYAGNYSGSGAGAVQLNSGQISIVNPGATFNFAADLFQWNGGTISAGPPFMNTGTMTLLGSGGWGIAGQGFHNAGTMIHSGTGALQWGANAFMTNDANGIYDIQMDGAVSNGGRIDNKGLLKKSAGNGISTMFTGNPDSTYCNLLGGTVQVDVGTLKLGRGDNTGANFIVASGAVLDLNSSGTFNSYTGTYSGSGAGAVQVNGGSVNIVSPGATFNFAGDLFQWIAGSINAGAPLNNQGTITIAGTVGIGGGGFTNNGTIKGNGAILGSGVTNNGMIAPGNSAGRLDIEGNFTLGASSNLSFEIGGTVQGTTYDWLNKSDNGALTLNGTLTVRLINGFTPTNAQVFTILTTQQILQGAFSNVANGSRVRTADGAGSFQVTYSVINDPIASRNVVLSNFQTSQPIPRATPKPSPTPGLTPTPTPRPTATPKP
jgi:hypothetical protein